MNVSSLASSPVSRRSFIAGGLGGVIATAVDGARPPAAAAVLGRSGFEQSTAEVAHSWMATIYDVVWPEGLTPPNAARVYAYCAIAMYEAIAPTLGLRPLGGQLTDLGAVPKPHGRVDLACAMSASVATVAASLFSTAAPTSLDRLTQRFDEEVASRRSAGVPGGVIRVSVAHGRRVAAALNAWIARDGYSSIAGRTYTPPVGPDKWQSTPPNYGRAIEPYWAEVRPLVLRDPAEVAPRPPVPYSEVEGSEFWEEAALTYRTGQELTDEQRAVARFWTDNPLVSGLPSGHWMLTVMQVSRQQHLSLRSVLEAYAVLGVALHDAFLNCWTWKYRYNLLRPVTYVRRLIDPDWSTFVNTPQFPEFTSGHSVASRAAATVLTDLLGTVAYLDDSHAPRNMPARQFSSFSHAADEAAQSRLYGGIHYAMGIELGKPQGDAVGALTLDRLHTRG
jgi:hypothetical protein